MLCASNVDRCTIHTKFLQNNNRNEFSLFVYNQIKGKKYHNHIMKNVVWCRDDAIARMINCLYSGLPPPHFVSVSVLPSSPRSFSFSPRSLSSLRSFSHSLSHSSFSYKQIIKRNSRHEKYLRIYYNILFYYYRIYKKRLNSQYVCRHESMVECKKYKISLR